MPHLLMTGRARAGWRRPATGGDPTTRACPEPAGRGPRSRIVSFVRESAVIFVSAIVVSLLVKTFVAQAFFIPSASMRDTLREGDRVLVNKLAPGVVDVGRGDIVVFSDPGGWLPVAEQSRTNLMQEALVWIGLMPEQTENHLIKRVIALPGDRVVSTGRGDPLTVNGAEISESYVAAGASPSSIAFDVVVPEDSLWVMGDNRQQSSDSTYHLLDDGGGSIPVDTVVGTAFITVWPVDRVGALHRPGGVFVGVPDPTG